MSQRTIAIVGGGFSGTVLSVCLQSLAPTATRICLIERSGAFAHGTAYGSCGPDHLLNVPAGRMGAFPDRPLDFVHWLQRQPPSRLGGLVPTAEAFVPRRLYAGYLRHLLECALDQPGPARIVPMVDEVVDVREDAQGVWLRMASGASFSADCAVLAAGNLPPAPFCPDTAALSRAGLWHADPWAPGVFNGLAADAPVLLIGTGLTMVDAVMSLLDAGHAGPIHALSRHGLLPRRHGLHQGPHASLPTPLPTRLHQLVRQIRREIESSGNWRGVIDALRPVTQDLWRGLTVAERAQFRRHLCTWWDVHRHRMPPRIADRIEAAQTSGQLRVHAGRVIRFDSDGGLAYATCRRRGTGALMTLHATRIINCTGTCADITRSTDPLMQALLRSGVARPDTLRLGLDVTADGRVVGRSGIPSRRLFAVGPLTKGAAWEITAVPDIRRQCHEMACLLETTLSIENAPLFRRLEQDNLFVAAILPS